MSSFGSRLANTFDRHGQLCVGIDPHAWLLKEWDLPDDANGVRDFGLRVVEAARGRVGIVKPQVAFYERFGASGYAALEEVLAAARSAGLLVIADVKRGDVGTSVEAYGEAWLAPGSTLEADAMTVSAYPGVGSLTAPMELAERHGKGLFLLSATSNPEAAALQSARDAGGQTVAGAIATSVASWNTERSPGSLGSIGLVIGATVDAGAMGIAMDELSRVPILAPGFGHQGARTEDLGRLYGAAAGSVLVSVSRSVLGAGPRGIADAIRAESERVAACRA